MLRVFSKRPNINFEFLMFPAFWVSVCLVLASWVIIFSQGLRYGIDFNGGIEMQIKFKEKTDTGLIRNTLENKKITNLSVQTYGDEANNEFLIRLDGTPENLNEITKNVNDALKTDNIGAFDVRRTDVVGPRVGKELKENGFWAVIISLILILIYVAFRFEAKFAPGAVLSLVHDVSLTMAIFVVLDKEFNLSIIAALLTLVGYSLNDTIIIYDRIRENIKLHCGAENLKQTMSISMNQTLSRTILTQFLTLLVLVSLLIYGGPTLFDFSFALTFGIIVGAYSTLFVASPVTYYLDKYWKK